MADAVKGEVPVAFAIRRAGGSLTEEAVKQFCLANGAPYMHPRRVFFLDEMPLTPAKKIDRAALKAMLEARVAG
jgi:long-chain acyl-CoA synthetase